VRPAFRIWSDVEGLFRDNELQRAVYLEAEFRSIRQGELSITQYCSKLKILADALRDVGHPISEPSQVLNMLCGLNTKYRHLKPIITDKSPPHMFQSAHSYLLLEELKDEHDSQQEQDDGHALVASHGGGGSSGSPTTNADGRPPSSSGNSGYRYKSKNNKRGRGNSSAGPTHPSVGGGGGGDGSATQPRWAAGFNPWTGLQWQNMRQMKGGNYC
jgi:hypothetical protein